MTNTANNQIESFSSIEAKSNDIRANEVSVLTTTLINKNKLEEQNHDQICARIEKYLVSLRIYYNDFAVDSKVNFCTANGAEGQTMNVWFIAEKMASGVILSYGCDDNSLNGYKFFEDCGYDLPDETALMLIYKRHIQTMIAEQYGKAEESQKYVNEANGKVPYGFPFLIEKSIVDVNSELSIDSAGNLVVPIKDAKNRVQNYQTISETGRKALNTGAKVIEGRFRFGHEKDPVRVYVTAEFECAASIYLSTRTMTYVSFSEANYLTLCKLLAAEFPNSEIILASANTQSSRISSEHVQKSIRPVSIAYPDEEYTTFNQMHLMTCLEHVAKVLKKSGQKRFSIMTGDKSESKSSNWLIKSYIPSGEVGLLFAPPESWKSFVALSMAFSVCTGQDWYGMKVKQGAVFYVCGEGLQGIADREIAWRLANNNDQPIPNFASSKAAYNISNESSLDLLIEDIYAFQQEADVPVEFIIIDTLARNFSGKENDNDDIGDFVGAMDRLKSEFGSTVLALHHPTKADPTKPRGASSLTAGMDFEYMIKPTLDDHSKTKEIVVAPAKIKNFGYPSIKKLESRVVDLGILTEDNESKTSIVLVPTQDQTDHDKAALVRFIVNSLPKTDSNGNKLNLTASRYKAALFAIKHVIHQLYLNLYQNDLIDKERVRDPECIEFSEKELVQAVYGQEKNVHRSTNDFNNFMKVVQSLPSLIEVSGEKRNTKYYFTVKDSEGNYSDNYLRFLNASFNVGNEIDRLNQVHLPEYVSLEDVKGAV
ncbi:hypothetical protein D210916BOD24_10880 [Alteromonas sp. D210916BOD_24]|uniref:AAA family ATPase n=1 Tax=Alteromonas sp. D210916BOD_24 TaxID=3157618 RepID=UPI00399CDB61